jgi:hypothetical protein
MIDKQIHEQFKEEKSQRAKYCLKDKNEGKVPIDSDKIIKIKEAIHHSKELIAEEHPTL